MAGDKILAKGTTNGVTEYQPVQVGGVGNANKVPALNAAGEFDVTMIPGVNVTTFIAAGAISAGDLVNIFNNAGVANVRKADNTGATASKRAHGFAPAAIADLATGTVTFDGSLDIAVAGLTPGDEYYLGTAGGLIDAATAAALTGGPAIQSVGVAKSATILAFNAGLAIVTV